MPKPRTAKSRRSVPIPRRPRDDSFFTAIKPYYSDEVTSKLKSKKDFNVDITKKSKALKNYAKTFDVSIVAKEDVAQQLFNTRSEVFQILENELSEHRGIKVEVTVSVLMSKEDMNGNLIFNQPYFNSGILEVNNVYEIQIALDRADETIKKNGSSMVIRWFRLDY